MIEIVTGFVRSNILHHGLHASEDSPYLRIKPEIERIKYEWNRNGMYAEEYAASVVDKLLRKKRAPKSGKGSSHESLDSSSTSFLSGFWYVKHKPH